MSAADYTQMSTDELIQEFIAKTQIVGSAWSFKFVGLKNTPEREAMKQDIKAISAELRVRKPIAQVRQLFEHGSTDVRGWAADQFHSIDPEWSDATCSGITAKLSTREVLALSARAQQGAPTHPALEDMSIDQLIARFEDAAIREYATRFLGDGDNPWDVDLRNQIIDETSALVRELKSRNGVSLLIHFINHPNITVRRKAATHCLTLVPDLAVPVLEAVIATKDSFELGAASWTLDRWRSGVLK